MIRKQSRKIRLINKFVRIFVFALAIFIVTAALGTVVYVQVASSNILKELAGNRVTTRADGEDIEDIIAKEDASALLGKKITTIAVFGVDKDGYRTDVNMLVFFHHETGEIDIVSIPRDTKVKIPDEIFVNINSERSGVKQNTRINAIPAYVSEKNRNDVSVSVIENVFGIDVDYYVNMNLDGFKYIVDEVGPIVMDVPIDMQYQDLTQEPKLVINLKAGEQEIYGSQAEMLVRYRSSYKNGDIDRIDMQHEFMKKFMEQVLSAEKRFNIVSILENVFVHVTTDFRDAVNYLIYLDDISAEKISFATLPGHTDPFEAGAYQYDVSETKTLFESIINKSYEDVTTVDVADNPENEESAPSEEESAVIEVEPLEPLDPTIYTISVQNGTYVDGLAGRIRDMLAEEGLNIVEAVNYESKPIERTLIKAPNREVGEIIANYFDDPNVFVDETLENENVQIIIAVGSDDSDQ